MKIVRETVLAVVLALCHTANAAPHIGLAPSTKGFRAIQGRYVTVYIAPHECNVMDYGAHGDGVHDDSNAIQRAFDDCGRHGGGTILMPKGKTFLIFQVNFTSSHQELRLEGTALNSDDTAAWLNIRGDQTDKKYGSFNAFSFKHLAITGNGAYDGQGLAFWRVLDKHNKKIKDAFPRPKVVRFTDCDHVVISGIHIQNTATHVLEMFADHSEISHVTIKNPPSHGACETQHVCSLNTDGVDVHGDPFYIHNVDFDTGDDNIAIHANNTVVEDSRFAGGHGVSLGGCNFYNTNITVRNVEFNGTTNGIRIKSEIFQDTGHGRNICRAHVSNVQYSNILLNNVDNPILFNQRYQHYHYNLPATASIAHYEKILFKNITISGGGKNVDGYTRYVYFDCGSSQPSNCEHIVLEDLKLNHAHGNAKKHGMLCNGYVAGTGRGVTGINNCMK